MRISSDTILSDVSTSNQTTDLIELEHAGGFSVQITFTGTPNGTVSIQGTNDKLIWIPIYAQTVNVSTSLLIPFDDIWYGWGRVVWTNATSTGTITVKSRTKGF